MPETAEINGEGPHSDRVFESSAFLSHHRHVRNGRPYTERCGFCSKGMGAILTDVEVETPEPVLDEGDRGYEEGAAPYPYGI